MGHPRWWWGPHLKKARCGAAESVQHSTSQFDCRSHAPGDTTLRDQVDRQADQRFGVARARLKKTLGPLSLTALGVGAVIGSGIFTVIGTAIAGEKFDTSSILNTPLLDYLIHHTALSGRPGAGPAIAVSIVLVALVCALTGLCYAELASMIPIAGSAYTYTYATLGELIAWIIGWDLILEYAGQQHDGERGLCRAPGRPARLVRPASRRRHGFRRPICPLDSPICKAM